LRDQKHKSKRRKGKQTRNKAEEKNQSQQMTRHSQDAEAIASMPNYTCSADQSKGHNKRLPIMHDLLEEKMRQIHLYRDRNLRDFDIWAQKDIEIGEKMHVPIGASLTIVQTEAETAGIRKSSEVSDLISGSGGYDPFWNNFDATDRI
jgi:hypothetical protein